MIIEHCTMPVEMLNDYKSIEQKQTIFIRGLWDPKIIPISERYEEHHYARQEPSGLEGFTRLDRALKAVAWSFCFEKSPKNEYGCANSGLYAWAGEKKPHKIRLNDLMEASALVKNAARFLGASLVGIAEYDPRTGKSIPPEFPFQIESVIVLAIEMDYSACLTSPTLISSAATGLGYSRMVEVGNKVATFMRMLGYNAIPSGNDTALNIPIAIQAGLGEVGRNGLLITPEYGPRVRLLKIFTDMPLQADKPITFGVSRFCARCKKCAQLCPGEAITFDAKPTMQGTSISNCHGVLKWYTNPEKCFYFWSLNGAECNNCVACCPYNKWSSWHHGITQKVTEAMGEKPLFSKSLVVNDKEPNKQKITVTKRTVDNAICVASSTLSGYTVIDSRWGTDDQGQDPWSGVPHKIKMQFKNPKETSRILKRAAKFFGANLVGIAQYDDRWAYSTELHFSPKSIIVLAIEMNCDGYQIGSSVFAKATTGLGYSRLVETAKKTAAFIRQLGYQATACGDELASSIELAMMAGLGEIGRNGLLVTKKFGPRVQLYKVFTDLDLKADTPKTFGLKDFCASCTICTDLCPAQAIARPSKYPQTDKGAIDVNKCFTFLSQNKITCCECIALCPYSKPVNWVDDFIRSTANIPVAPGSVKKNSVPGSKKIINQRALQNWWKGLDWESLS